MKWALAMATFVGFGLTTVTQGGISYVSQVRDHFLNDGAQSDSAPDFSPFNSTITDPSSATSGMSMQSSTLAAGIFASGSVSYSGGGANGTFSNRVDVRFTVDAMEDWTLSGIIDSAGDPNGEENFVEIIFRNETTPSVLFGFDTFGGPLNVDHTISLSPGNEYRLIISLGGEYFGPNPVNSSYDLRFVPAPGAAALMGIGGLVAVRRRRS